MSARRPSGDSNGSQVDKFDAPDWMGARPQWGEVCLFRAIEHMHRAGGTRHDAVLQAGCISDGGSHSAERAERYDSRRYDDLRADSSHAAGDGRYGEALGYLRRAAAVTGNVGMARLVDGALAGLAGLGGQEGDRS